MTRTALVPPGSEAAVTALHLSPGLAAHGFVFVTGMTGSLPSGEMPNDPGTQFRNAFDKIGAVLAEAGLDHGDIVDMTSYHVDIDRHFEVFEAVRADYVTAPYPAWTAVEVAGLRRPGALVEIKVTAATRAMR